MYSHEQATYSTVEKTIHLERPGEVVFISHAHSDHIPSLGRTKTLLSSKATFDLIHAIKSRKQDAVKKITATDEIHEDGFEVSLLNSGHILGSSQFHAVHDGSTFTYTGDFKLEDSLTVKGADVRQADVLLIESTYGAPEYVFPSRKESCERLGRWAKRELEKNRIVLLGGYAVGKAQEIIAALNEYAGIAPLATSGIVNANEAYEKHGVKLDYVPVESSEGQEQLGRAFVAVVPFHQLKPELELSLEQAYSKKVSSAAASGWTLNSMRGFCISDHADFPQLLEYVERAQPKKVYCCNGFTEKLASELRKKGFNAEAL